jgi:predicted aspartyl protease
MKNYSYILLTIVVVIFYKLSLIGILENETFFIAIIVNILTFGSAILIIPLLLALKNKANYWLNVNKYTKNSLLVFIIFFIMPEIYYRYLMARPESNKEQNYLELKSELNKLKVKFGNQYDSILDFEKYFNCAISKIMDLPPNEIDKIISNLANPNSKAFNEISLPCVKNAIIKKTTAANTVIGLVSVDTISIVNSIQGNKIKLTIGLTEYYFLIDSGASEVFISAKMLSTFKNENPNITFTSLPSKEFIMANGKLQLCNRIQIEQVQLGKFIIPNVNFAIIEDDCVPLLGQNILNRFNSYLVDNNKEILILIK